jgi:hypothetical protein
LGSPKYPIIFILRIYNVYNQSEKVLIKKMFCRWKNCGKKWTSRNKKRTMLKYYLEHAEILFFYLGMKGIS